MVSRRIAIPLIILSAALPFCACDASPVASGPDRGARDDDGSNGAPPAAGASSGGSTSSGNGGGGGSGNATDPGSPHVQFIGRFDTRDAAGPSCAWPGCRIVARFDGSEVSVEMKEMFAAWMDGAPSEWDVAIDGAWKDKLVMKEGASKYVLATGLPKGTHTIELFKRSEAQNGTTQFLGFDFAGGTLLAPPARKNRRIEIIADSVASGYGVEGVGAAVNGDCPGPDYASKWQNFRVSLGVRLGEAVDAEVLGTVHSGKGVSRNIWRPDTDTLPTLFSRSIPADPASTWDFAGWSADAVVIMAGGNDFDIGQPTDDGAASMDEFTAAYREFLMTLRKKYPQAYLFPTLSPTVSDAVPAGRNTRTNIKTAINALAMEMRAAGDARVDALEPGAAQTGELTGCNGHGNKQFHQRVGQELAASIRAKLGW